MNKISWLLPGMLFPGLFSFSQQPVSWKYSVKKTGTQTYEVHMTASIDPPWHIYSQKNNESLGMPTKIRLAKNPFLEEASPVLEIGDLQKDLIHQDTLYYYENTVDFVQVFRVKAKVRTAVKGRIEYMACTNRRCLLPEKKNFSIPLGSVPAVGPPHS